MIYPKKKNMLDIKVGIIINMNLPELWNKKKPLLILHPCMTRPEGSEIHLQFITKAVLLVQRSYTIICNWQTMKRKCCSKWWLTIKDERSKGNDDERTACRTKTSVMKWNSSGVKEKVQINSTDENGHSFVFSSVESQ